MKDNKKKQRSRFPNNGIESYNPFHGFRAFILIAALWIALTSIIQRVMCPSYTETEIFIRIPNSFIGDFKRCDK